MPGRRGLMKRQGWEHPYSQTSPKGSRRPGGKSPAQHALGTNTERMVKNRSQRNHPHKCNLRPRPYHEEVCCFSYHKREWPGNAARKKRLLCKLQLFAHRLLRSARTRAVSFPSINNAPLLFQERTRGLLVHISDVIHTSSSMR